MAFFQCGRRPKAPGRVSFAGVIAGVHIDTFLKQPSMRLDLNLLARGLTRKTYLFSFSLINVDFSVNDAVLMISCGSFILSRRSPATARRRRVGPFRELFQRLVRNQNFLEREQLLGVHIGSRRELHRFDVARRPEGSLIERIGNQ